MGTGTESVEGLCMNLRTLRGLDHAKEVQLERTVSDLRRLLQYYPGTPMTDVINAMQMIHNSFGQAKHELLFAEFVDNMLKVTPMSPVTICAATQEICKMHPLWPASNFRECIHAVATIGAAFPNVPMTGAVGGFVPNPTSNGATVVAAVNALCAATQKFSIANPTVAAEGFLEIARTMTVTETLPQLEQEIFNVFDAMHGHMTELGHMVTFKHLVEATSTLLHAFKSEFDNRASVFLNMLPSQLIKLYGACQNENPTYMQVSTALSHVGTSFRDPQGLGYKLETCIDQIITLKQCFTDAKLTQISDRLCHHCDKPLETAVMELKNTHLDEAFETFHGNAYAQQKAYEAQQQQQQAVYAEPGKARPQSPPPSPPQPSSSTLVPTTTSSTKRSSTAAVAVSLPSSSRRPPS